MNRFIQWIRGIVNAPWVPPDYYIERDRRIAKQKARTHAMLVADRETCDICSGRSRYLCPKCLEPLLNHSHENDFICATHSFVNPIREGDGAIINGDGHWLRPLRILR